jgi:hypothetical protein
MCYIFDNSSNQDGKNKKDNRSILDKTNLNFEIELKKIEEEKFRMLSDFDLEIQGNNGIGSGYSYITEELIDTQFSNRNEVFDVSHNNNNAKPEGLSKPNLINTEQHNIDLFCGDNMGNFVEEWIKEEGYNKYRKDENESYFRKILSNNWDIMTN